VSRLAVLALVDAPPARAPRGVRFVRAAGVWAAVKAAPQKDARRGAAELERALRAHDRVLRALDVRALLPARFGTVVADERELAAVLAPRARVLRAALARVAGCVQMTLRARRAAAKSTRAAATSARVDATSAQSGAAYLRERARLPDGLARSRAAVAKWVRDERRELRADGPFAATLVHLIATRDVDAYRAAPRASGVVLSGPHPPYGFGPWPA
jgi:Gas vesicle synthesis protein GvpL/GvpF